MSDAFPPVIGKYKILGIIAKGGMGVVYKAEHPSLHRFVVIKKLTARGDKSNAERFKREAQILLDLQSPYIVHLFDYFTEGSYRYIVEEFVDGMALDKVIEREKHLPPQIALLILQDACLALRYAHVKGIIHRDIKPGNILISKRAEIKLADFGIASGDRQEGDESLTRTGIAIGTPAYMPPEQYDDSRKVDQRADIYALGIMLYEMVTGQKPYDGALSVEMLEKIRRGKYTPPQKIDGTIPHGVCRMIRKMIRADPRRRYQSVEPLLAEINRYLRHYDIHTIRIELAKAVIAPKPYAFEPITPKDTRRRRAVRIILASAAGIAAGAALWINGFFYRTVLRSIYTPVTVQMEMPPAAVAGSDLPVRAFFFVNDGDTIPEVPHTGRVFTDHDDAATIENGSHNRKYTIKPVYLRHGSYRIKVAAGPYIWWQSFSVGSTERLITCDFLTDARRPVKISPHAYDHETGRDITGAATFTVLYNGSWRRISDIPPGAIMSGTVWKIQASAQGYTSEIFSLRIDWYQDEVFISADLSRS